MIITGDNESEISNLRNDLSVRFDVKILGEIGCFLGLGIEKSDQGYFVTQRTYAKSLLECFSMGDSKENATPMEPNLKLKKDKGKPLKDARKFRQLVGSLIYLTITRLEISYSVSVVFQFMQNPRTPHLEAARRVLRYVKGTLDYGVLYKRCDNFVLSGFTDADWAGDTNDRHSTSGYCFNTGSTAVSWCSKKQDIVVLSSTKAEYVAATMATQECVWLKRLIGDMFCEVDYAVQIKCDNESVTKLASNPIFHARTIEVRYHFVRENVLSEDVELLSVRTNDQVADIFTKALVEPKLQLARKGKRNMWKMINVAEEYDKSSDGDLYLISSVEQQEDTGINISVWAKEFIAIRVTDCIVKEKTEKDLLHELPKIRAVFKHRGPIRVLSVSRQGALHCVLQRCGSGALAAFLAVVSAGNLDGVVPSLLVVVDGATSKKMSTGDDIAVDDVGAFPEGAVSQIGS
ncbi:hypothetical protein RJ640_001669 [Escallonia rubra]|uniref:Reverse transcriptase Ty1/copia-type domain-containing protein n=1 Tax=Escallonia rubra TaxID=112253 RepID=A0AA88S295_9ASTE|nr:hypothetical protein RJ640_001669 [Escallonia rubra]